ncbi:TetR/AcrR family transcriptional regulator [Bowmanella yangjiangensis]|uniref:TetR family transcriptional regulator n=1 Tax=Bowmanella yangjiangensis TaxID=2811230 RepID=A0ABS3CVC0_9ALTE|nr:TetR family transcriptional regulator [Bowmanella yangjiangensis]MBN7820096.1 TetR family transcriptional regulator [Bowmanella yangjiangensis]
MARKKEFDPDVALTKAMQFFWQNGFENTSVRDLISNTGVNFYGLYSSLGDKREIFLKSLDEYIKMYMSALNAQKVDYQDVDSAVVSAFDNIFAFLNGHGHIGCMVCNAAIEVAPTDAEVALKMQAHREQVEAYWRSLLVKVLEKEELVKPENIVHCAEFLCTQVYGLSMLLRAQSSQALISRHINMSAKLADRLLKGI